MPSHHSIHASCVALDASARRFGLSGDEGILLLGPSGAGKSDLALRLIVRGATLVADDRVCLGNAGKHLIASPPPELAGLLEVRGVGIVELPHRKSCEIVLAVVLIANETVPRFPEQAWYDPPAPFARPDLVRPRLLQLSAFENSAPDKIALAAAAISQNLFRHDARRH